jgi:hypothetical protein
LAPGFQVLTHGTGPGDQRHEPQATFHTQAQRPAPVPRTICHDPADPLKAEGETLFNSHRRFCTITPIPIPQAEA